MKTRIFFYLHLALVLAVALPMIFASSTNGFGINSYVGYIISAAFNIGIMSFIFTPIFPILLTATTKIEDQKYGVGIVVVDILMVVLHFYWMRVVMFC